MISLFKRADPNKQFADTLATEELPAFPALLWNVLEQLRDAETSLDSIADRISLDPALAVKLLKTVNSAAFGLRSPVHSVSHAVALMGRRHVESIVLSLAVQKVLPHSPRPGFDSTAYWRGAATRATLARNLATLLCPRQTAFNFTAALLQDMAIPLLAHHGPGDYGDLLIAANSEGEDLRALEEAHYGWSHAEVGAWMGERWAFPDNLTSAITTHHETPSTDLVETAPACLVAGLDELEDGCDWVVSVLHETFGIAEDLTTETLLNARTESDELARVILS